jgi:predicted O-methyltransferase YrrM
MKKLGVDWRFCPECQKIQHANGGRLNSISGEQLIEWSKCDHDYRPNSAKAVLENQAEEFQELGMRPYAVRTYQSPQELETLLFCVRPILGVPANTIVEIGSFHGGTASRMDNYLYPEKLICIDRCFDFWLAEGLECDQVQGNSTDQITVDTVKALLGERKIDLLFIDGDHSYAGEMADYLSYSPLVRDGGIIALHDTHSIPDVGRVFGEIPGKVKIDIFSYQGIGIIIK